ncbi:Scr1 family TA system antitoxin-like transcriptional regulator [Saccharopolyspora rosea]|uniref:Scr1 family TA system antitoxin-like transcriptional regulator n=1 Tax=Saccharopolyspora rosea TaxID=524884 RepID=UPI0037C89CDB
MPLDHGPYAGLSCPFTLLWIERARATIAYVETLTGADYVKTTRAYSLAFEQAQDGALNDDETLTLLDRYIAGIESE